MIHHFVGVLNCRLENDYVPIRDDADTGRLVKRYYGHAVPIAVRNRRGGLIAACGQDDQGSGEQERKNFHCFLERMSEVEGRMVSEVKPVRGRSLDAECQNEDGRAEMKRVGCQ